MLGKLNQIPKISIVYDLEPNIFGQFFLISWNILPYDLELNTYGFPATLKAYVYILKNLYGTQIRNIF